MNSVVEGPTTTTLRHIWRSPRVAHWSLLSGTPWSKHRTARIWLQLIFVFLVFLKKIWQVCTFFLIRRSKNGSQNGCVNLGTPHGKKLFLKCRLGGKNVSIQTAEITCKIRVCGNLSGEKCVIIIGVWTQL